MSYSRRFGGSICCFVSAPHIPAGPRILGFFMPSSPALLFSSISYPEPHGKAFEYVYDSELVVPWSHLPPHEGAWGAVCCCRRFLGGKDGCPRVPKEAEKAPKTPPRAFETSPKRRINDQSALPTCQNLPNHELSAPPSDYER